MTKAGQGRSRQALLALAALTLAVLAASPAWALEANEYRQVLGLDSRKVVWFLAQMHLFFGAFVLGVPLFAVIIEIVGWKNGDERFDKLAYEFTSLLSVAYATTAALGGMLAFALFTLYPTFMGFMAGAFKDVFFVYAILFFAETFCLYLYYYGWKAMQGREPFGKTLQLLFKTAGVVIAGLGLLFLFGLIGPEMRGDTRAFMALLYVLPLGAGIYLLKDGKSGHILIGILLNLAGTGIMQAANSMAGFMMSPAGVSEAGEIIGSTWQVFENVLATPVAIHRMLGNLAFGGLVAGSYAAVKFIGAKTAEEKAHYDWMGYIANFVAIAALIPLPFAGYYLGREVYSTSAVMGNNMMGGDFSWTFIIQAVLVGSLFLISNYYLWSGMTRIPGSERYYKFIKFILFALIVSFAIWLTPHNLPLTGSEVGDMGGSQYHPTLKFLGLMPAKNAVVNLIIISTFVSFLLYRRGNKADAVSIRAQGRTPMIVIGLAGAAALLIVGQFAWSLMTMSPAELDLPADTAQYFRTVGWLLIGECAMVVVAVGLALTDRGKWAQALYLAYTVFSVVLFLGVYGFVVMEKASPFLRDVAVAQFLQLISALILVSAIDLFLFKGAQEIGPLQWGKMTNRSQYALLALTFVITMNMGLMGFIRSGLRGDWHIFGVMRDTSEWSYTPTNATMTEMVSLAVLVFMVGVAFMFWLGSIAAKKD
ncbi:MAG TPA: cytochrome ubiquinol oxidase subunit I [Alphaproteobacteria bacterium]|nr:cytochrome ubiquinol oxidase subunit I [Alphaproteobacteria bacterium]MDP6272272.1 cytochrome ubiquinol oxidase subunit I [Alphaproteobacteria bacterium]HJM50133.1 cytochrome ubiquinol oxidase subunit I [Alphaproteobacteria bacterium]